MHCMRLMIVAIPLLFAVLLPTDTRAQVYEPSYPGDWPPTYSAMFVLGDTWYRTGLHHVLETSTDRGRTWEQGTPAIPIFNIIAGVSSDRHALALLSPMRWAPASWEDSTHTSILLFRQGTSQPDLLEVPWFVPLGPAYLRELQIGAADDALFVTQAFSEAALIRSTDEGLSWEQLSLPDSIFVGHAIFPFFVDGDRGLILAAAEDSRTRYSVYITHDAGARWSRVPGLRLKLAQTIEWPFVATPVVRWLSRDTVVLVDQDNRFLRSTDGGLDWQAVALNQDIADIADIAVSSDGEGFMLADDGALYRIEDFGNTKTILRSAYADADPRRYRGAFLFRPDHATLGLVDRIGQVLWTNDGGVSWVEERPLQSFPVPGTLRAISKDTAFVGLYSPTDDRASYFRTDNGGLTWKDVADITGSDIERIHFASPTLWYALRPPTPTDSTIIQRSTDGGTTWVPILARMLPDRLMNAWNGVFHNGDRMFWMVSSTGIHATADGGTTWDVLADGLIPPQQGGWLDISQYPVCYLATIDAFLRSSDGGEHWTQILTYQNPYRLLVPDAEQAFLEYRPVGPSTRTLLRSSDGGRTWDSLTMAPGSYTIGRIEADGSGAAIGFKEKAFLRTRDFWRTFEVQEELYGHIPWDIQFVDARHGWVMTNRMILRTGNGGVTWADVTPALPSSLRIPAVWPQPLAADGMLHARIESATPGHARLELHDLLGRRRAIPFDGQLDGRRDVQFSMSGLEAGVYLLQFFSGGESVVRVVVKR